MVNCFTHGCWSFLGWVTEGLNPSHVTHGFVFLDGLVQLSHSPASGAFFPRDTNCITFKNRYPDKDIVMAHGYRPMAELEIGTRVHNNP